MDLTSYGMSTYYFAKSAAYRDSGKRREAEDAKEKALLWMLAGLAMDVVGLVLLGAGLDHVERIEVEVEQGGGPISDAYAAALGISTQQVLAAAVSVQLEAEQAQEPLGDLEMQIRLFGTLIPAITLSNEMAGRVLFGLHQERSGASQTHWHQTLSQLSGVPVQEISVTVQAVLDERLDQAAEDGAVLSARSVLGQGATATLGELLDALYVAHGSSILEQIDSYAVSGASTR